MNVEYHHPLVQIHIALLAEDVQRAGGVQFQRKGNLFCLRLWLLQQGVPQGAEGGNGAGESGITVDHGNAPVNDGLVLGANTFFVDLLDQGHDELGFDNNGVVLPVAVHHVHGVEPIPPACGNVDHRAYIAHGFYQRGVLAFGIAYQNVVLGVQHQEGHKLLGREGFARAGNAQQERGLVQKILLVAHNKVVGDGIFPKVDTALVHDFLHLKGHEHRKAFRGQSAEGVELPGANRQHGVQSVHLLIFENRHLAHPFSCCGENGIRVRIQLLFGVGSNDHGQDAEDHPLVTGGQVIQKLLALLPLQLHVIGNHSREIVVAVLTALPVGDVRLHTQQTVFHLTNSFVRGDGHHVNGEHHVPVQIRQLGHEIILNIAGVVLEVQYPRKPISNLEIVAVPLDRIRAYVVPEAVTLPGRIPQREPELIFFSAAVEAVENLQPLNGVHGAAGGTKGRKVRGKVGFHTGKEAPGGIHIFSADGDGDELLLNNAVAIGGLVQKHLVVFLPVVVQTVPLHRHEDGLLKVDLAHAVVEDGDFCGGSAVQTVDDSGVSPKHLFLARLRCHLIVNIREAEAFCVPPAGEENPVLPYFLNGDHVLNTSGNDILLPILPHQSANGFHHFLYASFSWLEMVSSNNL